MKTEVQRPNIIRIAYHQEPEDAHYGSCLWAYFDFDLDRYMLSIQSDCGSAAYRWVETPKTESFLHLMAGITPSYLIDKLFKVSIVDVDATLDAVRDWLGIGEEDRNEDLTVEEQERRDISVIELEGQLNDYTTLSYDLALRIAEDWQSDYDYDMVSLDECIMMDYTTWQKRIVHIFQKNIQPEIMKLVADEKAKEAAGHGQENEDRLG